MISHCRVFQSVSVFSRQYILKSEGEIGSGSPEREQTRHMMLSCALLYFPQSATKYLWGHLPMMLRQSSGVCVETKTAKNQWIYAYISDILFTALILHDNWMNGIVFSLHIYFLSEWNREKNVLGWINFRPIHSKKRWHDVSPITKNNNILLCVDKSVAYKIGLSMFVVKWLIGWARSHDLSIVGFTECNFSICTQICKTVD